MKWVWKALKYIGIGTLLALLSLLLSLGCGVAVIYGKLNGWWTGVEATKRTEEEE